MAQTQPRRFFEPLVIAFGAVAVVLAMFWFIALAIDQVHSERAQDQRGAHTEQREPTLTVTTGEGPQAYRADYYAPEEHEEPWFLGMSAEHGLAWLTLLLVGGTFALAVFTFRLWAETRDALAQAKTDADLNRKQAVDLFASQQRPWISIEEIRPVAPFEYQPVFRRWQSQLAFSLRNVGGSPAQAVRVYVSVSHSMFAMEELEDMRRRIESGDVEEWRPRNVERVIFPQAPVSQTEFFEVSDDNLPGSIPAQGENAGVFQATLWPSVYGYVVYRSTIPGDDNLHMTGFNFGVGFAHGFGARGPLVFNPETTDLATIRAEADQIILVGNPMGWIAN